MADALDFLRRDVLRKRINGVAGGNRILWEHKDLPTVIDRVMSAKPEEIIRAAPAARKLFDLDRAALLRSVAAAGVEVKRDMQGRRCRFFICYLCRGRRFV
jgi:hypothetical protein